VAKYSSSSVSVVIDNSSGSGVNLTQYIQTIGGFDIEAQTEESHSFGDSWVENLATGIRRGSDLVIGGIYDDTSTTGPDAILNAVASAPSTSTRTVVLTYGGSKTSTFEANILRYNRTPVRNELTKFECTLQVTGAVTEA